MNKIPIRNIYYLLSYAWDQAGYGSDVLLGTDSFEDVDNLYAALMDISLGNLYKRGFRSEYHEKHEAIAGIRGKLHLSETLKSGLFSKGKTWCEFDEFSVDNNLNQIIKNAIRVLLKSKSLSHQNILNLRQHLSRFSEVSDIGSVQIQQTKIRFNAHNIQYRFIVELCNLIRRSISISQDTQEIHLRSFIENETEMFRIFESFVLNFYKRELSGVKVGRDSRLKWSVETQSDLFAERVPELNTDISIFYTDETLVMDTKFYVDALVSNRGYKKKYRREHLSQLMEYLRISEREYGKSARGMLLYPTVGEDVNDSGKIEGFQISICTVDLSKEWSEIRKRLLWLASKHNHADVAA